MSQVNYTNFPHVTHPVNSAWHPLGPRAKASPWSHHCPAWVPTAHSDSTAPWQSSYGTHSLRTLPWHLLTVLQSAVCSHISFTMLWAPCLIHLISCTWRRGRYTITAVVLQWGSCSSLVLSGIPKKSPASRTSQPMTGKNEKSQTFLLQDGERNCKKNEWMNMHTWMHTYIFIQKHIKIKLLRTNFTDKGFKIAGEKTQ